MPIVDDIFRGSAGEAQHARTADVDFEIRGRGGNPPGECAGSTAREIQLFGSFTGRVVNGFDQFAERIPYAGGDLVYLSDDERRERLWLISSRTITAFRIGVDLAPATPSQLKSKSLANAAFTERGITPLIVRQTRHHGSRILYGDCGQDLETYAISNTVSVLVPDTPTPWVEIVDAAQTTALASGSVADVLLQLSIQPIEQSRGRRNWLYTTHATQLTGAAAALQHEIPPNARYLQAFEMSQTGFPALDLEYITTTANTISIPFTGFSTGRVYVADATHVRIPSMPAANLQFAFVWEIWP